MLTKEDIEKAMKKATIGHRGKWEVVRMLKHPDDIVTGYIKTCYWRVRQ